MLDVEANYKNKYQDLQCRLCGKEEETQEHVLAKCEKTKQTKHQVPTEYIFMEDPEKLRKMAAKLKLILQTINNPPPQHKKPPRRTPIKKTTTTQPSQRPNNPHPTQPPPETDQQPKTTKPIPQPPKHQQE